MEPSKHPKTRNMKKIILLALPFVLACNNASHNNGPAPLGGHEAHMMPAGSGNYCDSVNAGLIKNDTVKGSPHRIVMATVNGTHVHIEYGSPGVKDRVIWGGLVAYDKVWVTGAHNATSIQFSKPVMIGDKMIPAGTYGLFTIPGKESWQVIINSRYEQHLADDYKQEEDLVRIPVKSRETIMTPRLTYQIKANGPAEGEIKIQWEKLEIDLPFKTITK